MQLLWSDRASNNNVSCSITHKPSRLTSASRTTTFFYLFLSIPLSLISVVRDNIVHNYYRLKADIPSYVAQASLPSTSLKWAWHSLETACTLYSPNPDSSSSTSWSKGKYVESNSSGAIITSFAFWRKKFFECGLSFWKRFFVENPCVPSVNYRKISQLFMSNCNLFVLVRLEVIMGLVRWCSHH